MKYIHDYKDGSYCMSDTFKEKVDNNIPDYYAISDEDYERLSTGEYTLTNGIVTKKE